MSTGGSCGNISTLVEAVVIEAVQDRSHIFRLQIQYKLHNVVLHKVNCIPLVFRLMHCYNRLPNGSYSACQISLVC